MTQKTTSTRGIGHAAMPALMSLFIPGAGHLFMGLWVRGGIWLAGWAVLLLLGAGHLLPGLLLMTASGVDALVAARPKQDPSAAAGRVER